MQLFTFAGFEENKKRFCGVPEQFFSEILPYLDDAHELKLVLYLLWAAYTSGDFGTAFTLEDLDKDKLLMQGFSDSKTSAMETLQQAVDQAIKHNILIDVPGDEAGARIFFINSPRGRQAAQLHLQGEISTASQPNKATLDIIQPNLFKVYEDNIGPLTPIIADVLRDAMDVYPENWLHEAIQIAVNNNVRRWSYISTILNRWQEEGRDGTDRRHTQEDYRRYLKGEYGNFGQY